MTVEVFVRLTLEEVRRFSRTPWVLVGLLLLISGSWASVTLGERDYDEQVSTYTDQLQARLQSQVRGTGQALGRSVEPGLRVIRAPAPGSILVQGLDPWLPAAWQIAPWGTEQLLPYPNSTRRPAGTGAWDLEVLVRVVAGILTLAMGAASVVVDRTSGWVVVLRTLPMSVGLTSLARVMGGCLAVAALVALWWISLGLMLTGTTISETFPPGRVWLLTVPTLFYLWALFGLGATAAWLLRSSLRAPMVGVAGWLVIAVIGPALIALVPQFLVPAETRTAMERTRREQFADDMRTTEKRVGEGLSLRLPSSVSRADFDLLTTREFSQVERTWVGAVQQVRARANAVEHSWRLQHDLRRRVASWVKWAIPGVLIQEALAELMDTGPTNADAWEAAVTFHQSAMNNALFDDRPVVNLPVKAGALNSLAAFDRHPAPKYGDLPVFTAPTVSWSIRVATIQDSGRGLLIWATVFLVGAWLSGVRGLKILR